MSRFLDTLKGTLLELLPFAFIIMSVNISAQPSDCNSDAWIAKSLLLDTLLYSHIIDEGNELSLEIIDYAESNELMDCLFYLKALWNRGEYYEFVKLPEKAVELYLQIIPIAKRNQYHKILADTYISLERVHESNGRGNDARRYVQLAFDLIQEQGLKDMEPRWYMRSSSYQRIYEQDIPTAKEHAEKAIQLGRKYNKLRSQTDGYMLLGMMEVSPAKRINLWSAGKEIFIESEAYHGASTLSNSVASVHLQLGNRKEALRGARESMRFIQQMEHQGTTSGMQYHMSKSSTHGLLNAIYLKEGQIDSAYHHLSLRHSYDRKIERSINHTKINDAELQFALSEGDLKDELYEKQRFANKLLLITAGLLTLFFIGLYIYINRSRLRFKKQNKLITAQNENLSKLNRKVELLLSEIHHRLKNNLQSIVSLLLLEANKLDSPSGKQALEDISYKVNSIAELHRELYREDDLENINLENYLNNIVDHQMVLSNQNNISLKLQVSDIFVTIDTAFPLGIITSELFTNTLKHAKTSGKPLSIELHVDQKDDNIAFIYQDNGVGYNFDSDEKGYGSFVIQSMCNQLKGKMVTMNKGGARFEMYFEHKELQPV